MGSSRLQSTVRRLYEIVDELEDIYPGRPFTPDGHLVGSLGECLVADAYGLELMPPSNAGYDAKATDGSKVEIKATQGKSVAFRSKPVHCIAVKLFRNGSFEEIYNGPGEQIWKHVSGKPVPRNGQYQIYLTTLRKLQETVESNERIPRIS